MSSQIPILVTGGAGYIGSHVCKELARLGYLPITYDNLSTGHSYAVKWGPFINADLADRKALDQVFIDYKPKAVIHFAGSSILIESVFDPRIYYRNNVSHALNLIEAMKDHGVNSLVFSSSCASYGIPKQIPITEEEVQNPISPYGRSKWMVEQILRDFEDAYSIHSISLRYFNAAGADFDLDVGEHHDHETHIIPLVIYTAMGLRKNITIYGNDFPTPDGTAVRDFIHVADLARAHISALQWVMENQQSTAINLGTSKGCSVRQIVETVEKFTGKPIPLVMEKKRAGEPPILVADNGKAQKLLRWQPRDSDLMKIIESAWGWHQKQLENKTLISNLFSDSSCKKVP